MKYHIYRFGIGCKWMDNLEEAAKCFNELPSEGRYIAIGITEGPYAIDVVFKGEYAGKESLIVSQDVKLSSMFEENPTKIIQELRRLYLAVGVREDVAHEILEELPRMAAEFGDDVEEM